MADISIPGVSDKYKTNDLVKALVEQERVPITQEQKALDTYKDQQSYWRRINQYMSALRESTRSLYSFDNPFSEKLGESTKPESVTVDVTRDASFGSFKVDVNKIATADRFISPEVNKNTKIPQGVYKYTVGDKTVTYNWKGGKLSDFVEGLNKRGNGIIKASIIGVSKDSQALLIESLKTGKENKLVFQDKALDYAIESGMLKKIQQTQTEFGQNKTILQEQKYKIDIPENVIIDNENPIVEFSIKLNTTEDITQNPSNWNLGPQLPTPSSINFKGIEIHNEDSNTLIKDEKPPVPKTPVEDKNVLFLQLKDGSETSIEINNFDIEQTIQLTKDDINNAKSITINNINTGHTVEISTIKVFDENSNLGYEPINPVSVADDAKFKYEGITMYRPTNNINDVVPGVTLNLESETERAATITIKPDTESAKDAVITFVGKYNQLMTELNILTQSKDEIITEIEYFSDDEVEDARKRLGTFRTEFSLTNSKSNMQRIITNAYPSLDENSIKLLSQIGVSSNASSSSSLSNAQLRGYLEINEETLDKELKEHITQIKDLFGYDTDGDLVIDNGIAYLLDTHLQSFIQLGGIIATKNSSLDTKITNSEKRIQTLESKLADTESELKRKYGNMESTLNSLESQSTTISNFSKQNSDK